MIDKYEYIFTDILPFIFAGFAVLLAFLILILILLLIVNQIKRLFNNSY